jgi:spore maturation protein CgeB
MVEAINSYKIHFNCNISNDINYRSFETIGCGTLLLTNYNVQYETLGFKDFENCVFFYTIEEAIEKFNYIINNEDQLNSIAAEGYKLSRRHTYTKRLEEVLSEVL